jgi:uncharacterized protein YggE
LVAAIALLLVGCEETTTGESASSENLQTSLACDGSQQTGIWVSGEGKVAVVPDVAILSLGVEAQEKTVKEAQTEAATVMTAVVAALKSNGVADKDIQTTVYTIEVVTKWDKDTEELITVGYKVTNIVNAKLRDISKAGTVIDAVAEAGGDLTRIRGISFTVDNPTSYYTQARAKAMADAKAKAEQMANLANIKLGKPTYINESSYIPIPYPVRSYIESGSATTPISPGELEITITVQVAYSIQ